MSAGHTVIPPSSGLHTRKRNTTTEWERYHRLTPEGQHRVVQIIERHRAACAKYGIEPHFISCFREAIGMIEKGQDDLDEPREPHQERQSYPQYQPPVDVY